MSKQDYYEKLKHPLWQKKRLKVLENYNFKCYKCEDKETTLHIHHLYYDNKYKNPWDYPDDALIALCEDCHEVEKVNADSCIKFLIKTLKERRFLTYEIHRIAEGFYKFHKNYDGEIDADIIHFFLTNEEMYSYVANYYINGMIDEK